MRPHSRHLGMQHAHDPERDALITVLKQHTIIPHKRLGQVFLFRQSVAEEIVRLAHLSPQDVVVEIGTGLGALTFLLAHSGAPVFGLEYDSMLAAHLKKAMDYHNVEIIRADALHFDYINLYQRYRKKLSILGNLPYYLTSPLIFKLLGLRASLAQLVLMMQREVADRISAPPGAPGYGIISIFSQLYFQVSHRLTVLKDCFYPLPAVDSEVVVFTSRSQPAIAIANERAFETLVRVSFAQPRKTLLNALKASNYFNRGKEEIVESLNTAGIDPQRRPQTVSIDEFGRLSNALFPHSI